MSYNAIAGVLFWSWVLVVNIGCLIAVLGFRPRRSRLSWTAPAFLISIALAVVLIYEYASGGNPINWLHLTRLNLISLYTVIISLVSNEITRKIREAQINRLLNGENGYGYD